MFKPRRLKPKRKVLRRRRAVPRAPRTGQFLISRKVTSIYLTNSATVGQVTITPKTGIVNVGNLEPHPVFAGVYKLPFACEFSLGDLAQFSDIANICDRYKLLKAQVKVQYNANSVAGDVAGGLPAFIPNIKYITDVDDSQPSGSNIIDAKMGVRTKALADGKFVTMSVRPVCAPLVNDNSQSGNAYEVPSKSMWINTGYPLVPHYGIKGYIENLPLEATTVATSCLTWTLTYTVLCRDLQ